VMGEFEGNEEERKENTQKDKQNQNEILKT
jgi:hypothetical protein